MADSPGKFASVLRELRTHARLTQQELADAAGLSLRTVSDLERGTATTPQKETVRLLADALHLIGPERAQFERAARGRPLPSAAETAMTAAAIRSLPRDITSFTGRQRELDQLVEAALTFGGVVSIHAIGGMAGVGKTAFAVHAAHRLAGQFPGGQLFLSLHGHTPGQRPVDPADALASLLLATGVPPAQVPADPGARLALWRDRAASRPLLLVLDDAASSAQVEPLLPGAGGSLVLVTSRRRLSALDDATPISLDTLPPDEAAALLVRLSGRSALTAGDPAVAAVTRLCGQLPLAIGLTARQLRHHPAWTVAGRVAELASARDRLGLMENENLSVAAAFDLSYADLTVDQQRLFRRIGLHPGSDIDDYSAAALSDISLAAARRGLEALYDQYLVTEPEHGRYRLHDLIREHARALADRVDTGEDRDAAIARLLDYYQHAGAAVNARIARRSRPGPPAAGASVPAAVPVLDDVATALAWGRAELASLLACLDYAAATGQHARVVALTAGPGGILLRDGRWADAVARQSAAVQAARYLGDQPSQANALIDLGNALRLTENYPAAVLAFEEALGVYRELADRRGQADALARLGELRNIRSDYLAAVPALDEALGVYRELADRRGQARALSQLGSGRRQLAQYPAAVLAQVEAIAIYRDLGDRLDLAEALYELAVVRYLTGEYPAAVLALDEALGSQRDLRHPRGQAVALCLLGRVRCATGDYQAALLALDEAISIARNLGYRLGQANALAALGTVRRLTGDFPAAAGALDEALGVYGEIGDRGGAVTAVNERGALYLAVGEVERARECHRQSLELSRALASPWDEAHALAGLGRCALAAGRTEQAETPLREALRIMRRLGVPQAAEVVAELDALPGAPPAP